MEVSISSRNVRVTQAMEETARRKIGALDRIVSDMDRAEVHFFEEQNPRIEEKDWCEVTMAGHGHHVRAKASAADPLAAVDVSVAKLEKQLRKLKTKLQRHRTDKHPEPVVVAVDSVEEDESRSLADNAYITSAGQEIVKRKTFDNSPMSVDEAVQRMELVGHDFFLFNNSDTGYAAVLYRRRHGGLGLIDHEPTA